MACLSGFFLVAREADVPARTHRSVEVAGVPTLAINATLKVGGGRAPKVAAGLGWKPRHNGTIPSW